MVRETPDTSRPDGPVRMCVGCRERSTKYDLLRVVAVESGSGWTATPDPERRAPGRGAYVHPTPDCLDLAVRRRALPRALRVTDGLASDPVRDHLRQQAT